MTTPGADWQAEEEGRLGRVREANPYDKTCLAISCWITNSKLLLLLPELMKYKKLHLFNKTSTLIGKFSSSVVCRRHTEYKFRRCIANTGC